MHTYNKSNFYRGIYITIGTFYSDFSKSFAPNTLSVLEMFVFLAYVSLFENK